jgi:hypothetical protein
LIAFATCSVFAVGKIVRSFSVLTRCHVVDATVYGRLRSAHIFRRHSFRICNIEITRGRTGTWILRHNCLRYHFGLRIATTGCITLCMMWRR